MLKLSEHSKRFLQENNLNLLLLLEDAAQQQDVTASGGQSTQGGQLQSTHEKPIDRSLNSDDEPSYDQAPPDQAQPDQAPVDPGTLDYNNPEMPTEEDIINQDINIADAKFVQFRLYDKITNLQDLVNNLKNITTLNEDERDNLEHFSDYVIILNELIFTLDVNVIYQLVGQLEIDMTTFLDEINERALQKKQNQKLGGNE